MRSIHATLLLLIILYPRAAFSEPWVFGSDRDPITDAQTHIAAKGPLLFICEEAGRNSAGIALDQTLSLSIKEGGKVTVRFDSKPPSSSTEWYLASDQGTQELVNPIGFDKIFIREVFT